MLQPKESNSHWTAGWKKHLVLLCSALMFELLGNYKTLSSPMVFETDALTRLEAAFPLTSVGKQWRGFV